MTFRKIPYNEAAYIETKSNYESIYNDFENFAEKLTLEAGNSKKSSGKASSYARYLMRLIIFYEEIYGETMNPIISFDAVKKLEQLSQHEDFKAYNRAEKHFPSATIACFRAYIASKHTEQEEYEDFQLNLELHSKEALKEDPAVLVNGPKRKSAKKQNAVGTSYPRSLVESVAAKKHANSTCEISHTHYTFKNAADHQNYIEAHHLIPMAAQDYFDYTIDFADNIVTLCPNCHRQIHYAVPDEKAELVEMLFKERRENYRKYGIEIDLTRLKNFYGLL